MAELPKDMIFHYHSDDGITVKVDAIPLVRCGECKYWMDIDDGRQKHEMCAQLTPNWFCADGAKMEVQDAD